MVTAVRVTLFLLLVSKTLSKEFRLGYITGKQIVTLQFQTNAAAPILAAERIRQQRLIGDHTIK